MDEVEKVLGPLKFEEDIRERINEPGIAVGMAWTEGK
jgi:ATP-dependent Lon protease